MLARGAHPLRLLLSPRGGASSGSCWPGQIPTFLSALLGSGSGRLPSPSRFRALASPVHQRPLARRAVSRSSRRPCPPAVRTRGSSVSGHVLSRNVRLDFSPLNVAAHVDIPWPLRRGGSRSFLPALCKVTLCGLVCSSSLSVLPLADERPGFAHSWARRSVVPSDVFCTESVLNEIAGSSGEDLSGWLC